MKVQREQTQEEIIQALRHQVNELIEENRRLREQLAHKEPHTAKEQDAATDTSPPHLDAIRWIKAATGLSQERIGHLIGVTRQTINRWENGEPITDAHRRRLFEVRDVLERAARRYDTPGKLVEWLDTPSREHGSTPAELLEAEEIDRARYLAVSTPFPGLAPVPEWVGQPIPEAFRKGAEHRQEALPPSNNDELFELYENEDEEWEELPNT